MRLKDVRTNSPAGRRYTSHTFTPDPGLLTFDANGNLQAEISITIGQLQTQNGDPLPSTVIVEPSAELKILLSASTTNGSSAISTVTQNGETIGYFAIITENITAFDYDERYDDLFSAEVVADSDWTPKPDRWLKTYDFDGVLQNAYDLRSAPTDQFAFNCALALDFNRDQAVVFDTDSNTISRVLFGLGPISSSIKYTDMVRDCAAIAFNRENKIKIYDTFFSLATEITLNDVAGVLLAEGKLWAYAQGQSRLYSWDLNSSLVLTNPQTYDFAGRIHSIAYSDQILICSEHELVDLTDTALAAFDADVRNSHVYDGTLYTTHGQNNYITKTNLSDFSSQKIVIADAFFLDVVNVQAGGRVYVSDLETKKVYVRDQFNQDWDVGYGAFGIAFANFIYLFDAYNDLPSKIDIDALVYELDTTNFVDIERFPLGDIGLTGNLVVTESNKPIRTQLFPADPDYTLVVNGIDQPNSILIQQGDVVQVRFNFEPEKADPLFFGLVIDQDIYPITVWVDDSRIVPLEFKFEPVWGAVPDTLVTSNTVLIESLTHPVSVTTDIGVLIVNGVDVGDTYTIQNDDTLAIRVRSDLLGCNVVTATVTVEGRFSTPFSVSTASESSDPATSPRPVLNFTPEYNQPLGKFVTSSEITVPSNRTPTIFTIPPHYEAQFIVNGTPAGNQIEAKSGDKIRIRLKTDYHYETAHLVPISTCYGTGGFVAYTIGDSTPDPFTFGTILGASIKEFLTSLEPTIIGIGTNVLVPVLVPYGTELWHNGVKVPLNGEMDWRGVPLKDTFVLLNMSNYDTLQLKGYGRPKHGDTVNLDCYVGGRRGTWTIDTFDLKDSVHVDPTVETVLAGVAEEADWISDSIVPYQFNVKVTSNGTKKISKPKTFSVTAPKSVATQQLAVQTKENSSSVTFDQVSPTVLSHNNLSFAFEGNFLFTNNTLTFKSDVDVNWIKGNTPVASDQFDTVINKVGTILIPKPQTFEHSKSHATIVFDYDPDILVHNHPHHLLQMKATAIVNKTNGVYVVNPIDTNGISVVVTKGPQQIVISSKFNVRSFSPKPFVLFDLSDTRVFGGYGHLKLGREFEVIASGVLETIDRTDWFNNNSNRNNFTTEHKFEVLPQHSLVELSTQFKVNPQAKVVKYDPKYQTSNLPNLVNFVPSFISTEAHPLVKAKPDFTKSKESDLVKVRPNYSVTTSNLDPTLSNGDIVANKNASVVYIPKFGNRVRKTNAPIIVNQVGYEATDRSELYSVAPNNEHEFTGSYIRTPLAYELHDGYFATPEEAEVNGLSYGYELGEFYPIYVDEKGWAWTVKMPCANLCNPMDCPAVGYIQGG